jgi:hypothetical protein
MWQLLTKGTLVFLGGDVSILLATNTRGFDMSLWIVFVKNQMEPSPGDQDTSFYLNLKTF